MFLRTTHRKMCIRDRRNPAAYVTRLCPRAGGGRPLREISVTSLSAAAQERYRKEQSEAALNGVTWEKVSAEKQWYETTDRGLYRRCLLYTSLESNLKRKTRCPQFTSSKCNLLPFETPSESRQSLPPLCRIVSAIRWQVPENSAHSDCAFLRFDSYLQGIPDHA